ncbi:unnamed protein product [Ilex paraguariensis]|uniref:Uncharacterized protein n=1 Tax=Ilex paraguariensis TaxID=185542 RepID=A0ABC8QSM1_9AQUA
MTRERALVIITLESHRQAWDDTPDATSEKQHKASYSCPKLPQVPTNPQGGEDDLPVNVRKIGNEVLTESGNTRTFSTPRSFNPPCALLKDPHWATFLEPSSVLRTDVEAIQSQYQFPTGVSVHAPSLDEPYNLLRARKHHFFFVSGTGWVFGKGAADALRVPRSWGHLLSLGKALSPYHVYNLCQLEVVPIRRMTVAPIATSATVPGCHPYVTHGEKILHGSPSTPGSSSSKSRFFVFDELELELVVKKRQLFCAEAERDRLSRENAQLREQVKELKRRESRP